MMASRVPKNGDDAKVRVVVRVRPYLDVELRSDDELVPCAEILKSWDGEDMLRISDKKTSRTESYKLDACYDEKESIATIFAAEVEPILPTIFRGFNATIFAYGATGSGKTHTMEGGVNQPGLMPLALERIVEMAEVRGSKVEVSFFEVYMDRCYDLLEPKEADITVLDDGHGRIQLRGLAQVQIDNIEDFHDLFQDGCTRRRSGHTGLNDVSSRSHSILSVIVTSNDMDNPNTEFCGKLNLIDLAGNENNRRSGNEGVRLAESTAINQSLFVLSNVINALNANEQWVPYRDCKLTRILQDSLGGTSRAVMVACLNPGNYQENSATLSMAARSRQVVNRLRFDHEEEARKEKMDMEAKLKAWRESKCKTSAKATTIRPSPLCLKNPLTPAPSRLCFFQSSPERTIAGKTIPMSGPSYETPLAQMKMNVDASYQANRDPGPNVTIRQQFSSSIFSGADEEKENNFEAMFPPLSSVVGSPPLSTRLKNLCQRMRALSPLPSNLSRLPEHEETACHSKCKKLSNFSTPNQVATCESSSPLQLSKAVLSDTITPSRQSVSLLDSVCHTGTPFERFSKGNPTLQRTLVKDYLELLNTADKDELLQLKGIGPKRAAEIMRLRENSPEPLKHFDDLQKIGLSERQAHAIFNTNVVRQVVYPPA